MKNGIYILLTLLIIFPAVNAATITQVDGDTSNGGVATITGSSFGTHTMQLSSKGVGPNGFIEQTPVGVGVDNLVGGSDFNHGFSTGIGPEAAVIDNENVKTGTKSFTTKTCQTCGGEYPSGIWQRPIQYGLESDPGFNEIYVSWWQYFDPVDGQYNNTQWKMWYIGGISHHSSCRSASTIHRFTDEKVPRQHYTEYYGTQYANSPGLNTYRDPICPEDFPGWPGQGDHFECSTESGEGSDISSISGEWVRFEVHAKLNDVGTDNGYMDYWLTRSDGRKHVGEMYNVMWQDPSCTRGGDPTGPWKTFGIHGYWEGGTDGPMIADQYVDDIYIQFGTPARIELGNMPNYLDNTELYAQYPISWDANNIEFEINYGTFNPGDTAWLFVIDDSGIVSDGFPIILGQEATSPTIVEVIGNLDDGSVFTISGSGFSSNPQNVEWIGGINGAIESVPVNTKVESFQQSPDPNWIAPGWVAGESVIDLSEPIISTENAYSGNQAFKHTAYAEHGPYGYVSTLAYQPVRDPEIPFTVFNETFASAWLYFNPLGNNGSGATQWKIMNIQHRMGGNIAEGNIWVESEWDNSFDVSLGLPHIYGVDENKRSDGCTFPCGGTLTCNLCVFPGPVQTSTLASNYYNGVIDSNGPSTSPPYESFEWMRLDLYVKASSAFDTWDGKTYARLTIPSLNRNWVWELDGIATHGEDPLLDENETLYPPFWDLVYDTVQWKNQISHNEGEAIIYSDDYYIQFGSAARVEICNNQDYFAATHCEMQNPLTWNHNSIQAELNYGTFPAGTTAYLFVIDQNNVASVGKNITLGQRQSSLLMHSSVSDLQSLYQPETNVETYDMQGQAIKNPANIQFVPGQTGTAAQFGNNVLWDGDVWFPTANFDFEDLSQDGGRLDLVLRFDSDPKEHRSDAWFLVDVYGNREINLELTGKPNTTFPMFMIGGEVPNIRTSEEQFRANVEATGSIWQNIQAGEWHTYTYVWRNNGDIHKDQAHIFIDGELAASDFSGNLPIPGQMDQLMMPAASGGGIVDITVDEIYSFNSWDTEFYPVQELNWPEGIMIHYPLTTGSAPWGVPVSHTNKPTYQFQVKNNLAPTTSCTVYVDGNTVVTFSAVNNLEHKEITPNIPLSTGRHNWQVKCDNDRLVSELIDFEVLYETGLCDDGFQNGDETGIDCGGSCGVCQLEGNVLTLQNGIGGYLGQTEAYINQFKPNDNELNGAFIGYGTRKLYHFDLTGFAIDEISNAELTLVEYDLGGVGSVADTNVDFYKLLVPWSATGVTWNCRNDENENGCADTGELTWNSAGANSNNDRDPNKITEYVANNQPVTINVTHIVREWMTDNNNGLLVVDSDGGAGYVSFVDNTHPERNFRPKLVITLTSTTGPNYNLDGINGVDINDLAILAQHFRQPYPEGDYDNSGTIDIIDLLIHIQHWD